MTFEVTELRRLTGSYNTMVGNNEGSMVSCRPLTFSASLLFPLLVIGSVEAQMSAAVLGSGPEAAQRLGSGREGDLPVLLWNQRDVLRSVLLQAAARTL